MTAAASGNTISMVFRSAIMSAAAPIVTAAPTIPAAAILAMLLLFGGCAPIEHGPQKPAPAAAASPVVAAPPSPATSPSPPPGAAAPPTTPAAPTPPPAPVPLLSFDDAVLSAANSLFSGAKLADDAVAVHEVIIDPLIDGMSGEQSAATQTMESRIKELVRGKYTQFNVQPFSAARIARSPIVLVGTFTAINKQGQTTGTREAYRICLALADLKSGKIVAKGSARARMEGIDATPTGYFRDSPAWMVEPVTEGYIKTCQGTKIGDPINPAYLDGILTAGLIGEAIEAYDRGRYRDALDLYGSALSTPAGDQLRVYNGIYLANWKLGRREAATGAFAKIVDHGLASKRLAVKFLFKPGSTAFLPAPTVSGAYPIWLTQIARRTAQVNACLEISGHTSRTGPEPLNERLSLLRAEYIRQRLEAESPQLASRTIASGVGSRENLIGTGRDDLTDALDRRVVFRVIDC